MARELGAAAVALRGDGVTPGVVRRAGAAGLRVVVWTVNRIEDARRARDLGVAGLCTDTPAEVRRGLAEGPAKPRDPLAATIRPDRRPRNRPLGEDMSVN